MILAVQDFYHDDDDVMMVNDVVQIYHLLIPIDPITKTKENFQKFFTKISSILVCDYEFLDFGQAEFVLFQAIAIYVAKMNT